MVRKPRSTEKYSNLIESSVGAFFGFRDAIMTETKIRYVFWCLVIAILLCIAADISFLPSLLVVFSWVLGLICEMFNTAVEKVLDYASGTEYHTLVRQGKDYAAACTFVAIVFASALTALVLLNRHFWV